MPTASQRPCKQPRCSALVANGYCDAHKARPRRALTTAQQGYGSRWQRLRLAFLRSNPLCVHCKADKRIRAANVVDHIVPHKGDDSLMWSESNLQPLCASCHSVKTSSEDGGFGNARRGTSSTAETTGHEHARESDGDKHADPGSPDKRLCVIEAEFASALRQMGREGNTLSPILREAWDGQTLRTLTKGDPLIASDPHLAVIGQITPAELRKSLGDIETRNGLVNRFLVAWSERARLLPFGSEPTHAENQEIVTRLSRAVVDARTICNVGLSTPGRDWWGDHYAELSTPKPGRVGEATQRAAAQVRRIAMIFAVLDCSRAVDVRHLEAALGVWDYAAGSAAWVFGGRSEFSPKAEKLSGLLLAAGPEGMSRSAIRREVFGSNNVRSAEIMAVLRELHDAGVARLTKDTSGEGRPTDIWLHIKHLNTVPNADGRQGIMGNMGVIKGETGHSAHKSQNSHFPIAS